MRLHQINGHKVLLPGSQSRDIIRTLVEHIKASKQYFPKYSHYDLSADLFVADKKVGSLVTDEQSGILRNVSLVRLFSGFKFIDVAIGNQTGNIAISKKPFWRSAEQAATTVIDTLQKAVSNPESLIIHTNGSNTISTSEYLELYKAL